MKLNTFVSQVLRDINTGLNEAGGETDKNYSVQTGENGGVNFDIAVTTISENSSEAEGSAKAGIVEVLGAGVKGTISGKTANSEVSRIKFTVFVPSRTNKESAANNAQAQAESEAFSKKMGF